jgi:hypothetical protein
MWERIPFVARHGILKWAPRPPGRDPLVPVASGTSAGPALGADGLNEVELVVGDLVGPGLGDQPRLIFGARRASARFSDGRDGGYVDRPPERLDKPSGHVGQAFGLCLRGACSRHA